jgi:tetratricopeptide (TPR) repeat protein
LSEAVAEYRRAVEMEPRFALARVEVAWIGFFSSDVSRTAARDILREAARYVARAPEKEAGLIRILSAFFDGRFSATRAEIRLLARRYPDDRDVAVLAAEVLAWSGDVEGAIPYFERALQLAPDWDSLRFDQVALLYFAGRGREALGLAEMGARHRATPAAKAVVGVARYLEGDVEGGIAAVRASGADDSFARAIIAQGLAAEGKIADAPSPWGHQRTWGQKPREPRCSRTRVGSGTASPRWKRSPADLASTSPSSDRKPPGTRRRRETSRRPASW